MLLKSKGISQIVYAALFMLALATGSGTFVQHLKQLRAEAESTFVARNELLKKFVAVQQDRVSVMRNLLETHYNHDAAQRNKQLEYAAYPELNAWALASTAVQAAGSVSGLGKPPAIRDIQHEIRAALEMDPQIRATQEFDKEAVWFYYLSARNFIYIAPGVAFEQFHFSPELYTRRYWLEAIPKANPAKRMILAGPYEDLAGKGRILTFAEPVYAKGHFLGVAAIDLRTDTMQQLTNIGEAIGESMLISENDRLIAKQSGTPQGVDERLQPPLSRQLIDWREDGSNDLWLSSPVVENELWLVHRLQRGELYRAAARESAATWMMIALLGMLGVMAWRLQLAMKAVVRMTHIDPLTQALNRRGFYEHALTTFALGKREKLLAAVLIMDIDYFKKVNDNYGHAEGDSVLKQLGSHLLKASRPYDLVCRWGGEEFVLVMLVKDGFEAAAAAERMRQQAMRTRIQPGEVPITLSGGLVLLRQGEEIDAAVKRADELLYQAKQGGRNQIVQDLQYY